ncbi:hypothetical protein HOO54_01005 [Bacillus sp. WMMC1349]|nr:hypothetical protein [Bacillus sp. WMMC1349]NPC90882.1 hypothetical protein [Bacillus sp. WMMC1349]
MGQAGIPNKVGIAIFSLVFALILGIPLLLVAFANFVVQILVLAISVILPLSCIISFLPNFANSAWYAFGRLVGTFLMKAFIGMILLFTFLIISITGDLIPMDTPDQYMLNAFVTGLAIILMIKYRDKIVEFITAGRVVSVDAGMAKRAYEKGIRQPAERATNIARTAASAYLSGTAASEAAQNAQERNENRETGEDENSSVSANAVTSNMDDSADRSELRSSQEDSAGKVVNMSDYKDSRQDRTAQSSLEKDSHEQQELERTQEGSSGHRHVGKAELNRDEQHREPQKIDQPAPKAETLNREQYRTSQARTSQDSRERNPEDMWRDSSQPRVTSWDENIRHERSPQSQSASQSNSNDSDLSSLAAMEPPMDEYETQMSQNSKSNQIQPTGTEDRRSERRQVQERSENHLPESPNRARGE